MKFTPATVSLVIAFSVCLVAQVRQPPPRTAGEAYKNIQVLRAVPENRWFATMSVFADSLGVTCDHCHAQQFDSDEKPAKLRAREMVLMVEGLNAKYYNGASTITCNSCHRGALAPAATPAPDLDHWLRTTSAALPSGDTLLSRYRAALRVDDHADMLPQSVSLEMATYSGQERGPEISRDTLWIGGQDRFRVTKNRPSGTVVYIQNGKSSWINDGHGWRPATESEMRQVRNDLTAIAPDNLQGLSGPTTISTESVHGRNSYVVDAKDGNGHCWLFFDAESGLLLRRRGFFAGYFGEGSWDVEYADYRKVGKGLLPFTVRVINPAGSGLTIRSVTKRDLKPNFDAKAFADPTGGGTR